MISGSINLQEHQTFFWFLLLLVKFQPDVSRSHRKSDRGTSGLNDHKGLAQSRLLWHQNTGA